MEPFKLDRSEERKKKIEMMEKDLRRMMVKQPCVGCGYCCMKSPCGSYLKDHLVHIWDWEGCPELVFEDGRHWCRLMMEGPDRDRVKEEQKAGQNCCSPCNSWRDELVDRRTR